EVGEEWPVGVGLEASGLEVGIYGGVLVRRGVEIRCPENGEVRGEAERGGGCPCRGPVDQPPRCTPPRPAVVHRVPPIEDPPPPPFGVAGDPLLERETSHAVPHQRSGGKQEVAH